MSEDQEYQEYLDYQKYLEGFKGTKPEPGLFNKGGAVRELADMATASVGGLVNRAIGGMLPIKYPGMQQAMKEHPDVTDLSGDVGSMVPAMAVPYGAGKLAGAGMGAAGKAVGMVSPTAKKVLSLIELLGKAAPEAEGAAQATPAVEAGLASVLKPSPTKVRIDPFTVRKTRLPLE